MYLLYKADMAKQHAPILPIKLYSYPIPRSNSPRFPAFLIYSWYDYVVVISEKWSTWEMTSKPKVGLVWSIKKMCYCT